MEKLSVVIITFNEERNIGRCLDSVKNVADEIIILDSFSTDRTVAIAKEKGAIVHEQPFQGYAKQKNRALEYALYNYILSLDADEALDAKLEASILQAKEKFTCDGYTMNRCTNYCGKFIRHGSWYPDRKLRLFDKRTAKWVGQFVHEKIEFLNRNKICHLAGDILHYSYYNVEEHIARTEKYALLSAQEYYQKGKRSGRLKLFINPVLTFTSGYILRLGFLDGRAGLLIARISARSTYLKYKKLSEFYKEKKKPE